MKRLVTIVLIATLLGSGVGLSGCKKRTVKVRTGEIVICTAGEIVEDRTKEIEVPVDGIERYSVTTKVITCDLHSGLAALYAAAQEAIAAGDLETARAKLEAVVAKNPAYRDAAKQLDDIRSGRTPTPGTGGTPSTQPTQGAEPPSGEVEGPVASLLKYVPDTLEGYVAQGITADPTLITRNYIPVRSDADLLVISAEQVVDAKMATSTIASIKSAYPDSGAAITLGSKSAYFGVRGDFAIVAFSDGAVVVSVEMHAAKGKALSLKDALIRVATIIAR